jgi:hypothetical protein
MEVNSARAARKARFPGFHATITQTFTGPKRPLGTAIYAGTVGNIGPERRRIDVLPVPKSAPTAPQPSPQPAPTRRVVRPYDGFDPNVAEIMALRTFRIARTFPARIEAAGPIG